MLAQGVGYLQDQRMPSGVFPERAVGRSGAAGCRGPRRGWRPSGQWSRPAPGEPGTGDCRGRKKHIKGFNIPCIQFLSTTIVNHIFYRGVLKWLPPFYFLSFFFKAAATGSSQIPAKLLFTTRERQAGSTYPPPPNPQPPGFISQ